jgi:hypothetical protein
MFGCAFPLASRKPTSLCGQCKFDHPPYLSELKGYVDVRLHYGQAKGTIAKGSGHTVS